MARFQLVEATDGDGLGCEELGCERLVCERPGCEGPRCEGLGAIALGEIGAGLALTGEGASRRTRIAIRRFAAAIGSAGSNGSRSASPITDLIRVSGKPPSVSNRRVALARSADSSQLVRSGPGYGWASVCPAIEIGCVRRCSTGTIFCISSRTRSLGVAEPDGNMGSLISSMI